MSGVTDLPVIPEGIHGRWEAADGPILPSGSRTITIHAEIIVMSIGYEGVAWLNEHAPGWEEHVAARKFETSHVIPVEDFAMSAVPTTAVRMAHKLGYMLGEEINSHFEPFIQIMESRVP